VSTDRRPAGLLRPLSSLLASLALLLALAGPAAADPSPGERIADALRTSPVYVAPGLETAVTKDDQRELAEQIKKTGLPVKVVLVPFADGDAWGGEPRQLADVLHDRLGGEAALITAGDYDAGWLQGFEWPAEDRYQARDAVAAVSYLDAYKDAGLTAKVSEAIRNIASGKGHQLYREATKEMNASSGGSGGPSDGDGRDAGSAGGSGLPLADLLLYGGLVVLLVPALVLFARRRVRARGPRLSEPFAAPRAVFAAARAADEQALRRRAQEEVLALGEDLATRDGATAAVGRALDAYTAATTVLDAASGTPDLAGVLALVAEGRDALHERPRRRRTQPQLPLCFFHPLHGRAVRRMRWRPLGRREELDVAACEECAAAVRAHRAPEVLTDRADGREMPYFEVPAERSLWAACGYGSFGDEPLAARVTRGDFRRTRT
jgi:hypothetical protein